MLSIRTPPIARCRAFYAWDFCVHCSVHKGLWFLPNRKQLELEVGRQQARKGCVESVSVQSVGTLEIGCPSACLTQNCGHANEKGLSDDIDPSHRIGSL